MSEELCLKQLTNPNPHLYNEALWEIAKGDCLYYRTSEATQVAVCSCLLSGLSSLLVIYIILISSTRLSSIYHRIVCCMSIADIVYCLSTCLSTLPMPAPGLDYWTDIINIQGPRIGNVHTCALQGFFFQLFLEIYCRYLKSLYIYYFCVIVLKVSEQTLATYVEPFMHIRNIFASLADTLPKYLEEDYNVGIQFPQVCISVPKPW